jgi:hypothetical protein
MFHLGGFLENLTRLADIGFGMKHGLHGGGARRMHFLGFIVTIQKDGFTLIWRVLL